MNYDDDFYTDEPIKASPQPSTVGEGDAQSNNRLWDYVPPSEVHSSIIYSTEESQDVPKDIALLMAMIRQNYWSITNSKSFYEQALFMAGYEDDYGILPFNAFFPTFRQMSYGQLRSYFTVRKLLRHGQHPDVPLSYLFVYAYETLMQIGVGSPEEGYEILCDLRDNYPAMNPPKRQYLTDWLRDYVVWYGLPEHYADCFSEELRNDNACEVLNNCKETSDEALFNVLDDNSRNVVSKGALYRKNRDAAISGVAGIMRSLAPVIEGHFGGSLGTLCFGRHTMRQHIMFGTAVFYAPEPMKEAAIEVAPLHKYVCHKGLWKVTEDATYAALPPRYLGYILHDVDAAIRQRLGFKPAINTKYIKPGSYLSDALPEAADAWFAEWNAEAEERKQKERRVALRKARESVSIDLGKLGTIREDADVVRDKLIVEGDDFLIDDPAPVPPVVEANDAKASSSQERIFIEMLLDGGDYRSYLRSIHTPAGVMVENINSKAMDVIGDIVLEDDGENITVIDDYREDIKHLYD